MCKMLKYFREWEIAPVNPLTLSAKYRNWIEAAMAPYIP